MEEWPWILRGCALMLEEYNGAMCSATMVPNHVLVWIKIHKIPVYHTKMILKQLMSRVGEVLSVEMKAVSTMKGDFQWMHVMYVKMLCFCANCENIRHVLLECSMREFVLKDLQFGLWVLANEDTWCPSTPIVCSTISDHVDNKGSRGHEKRMEARLLVERLEVATGGVDGTRCDFLWEKEARDEDNNEYHKIKSAKFDIESASGSPSGFWWLNDKIIKELMSSMSL